MHRPARQPSEPGANLAALTRRAAHLAIPANATWELTHRCPLECRHCYLDGLREEDELDTEEAKTLLGAMARAGVLFLTLTGGEPLAREDFLEIAAEARRLGFAWRLFTAGTLVDDGMAHALAELRPLAVDISLHGIEEAHDDLTRTPGSFRAAADAAERLAGLGLTVNLKTNLTPRALADLPGLRALAERIGAGHKIVTFLFPPHAGGTHDEGLVLSGREFVDYLVSSERPQPSVSASGERPRPSDPLCGAGRSVFVVSPGGDVRSCLMLKTVFGNVRETDLAEIWRSEGMAELRRTTCAARPRCLDCDDAEFCFPCPGLAEKETGDLLGASPTACREARLRHEFARASGVEAEGGAAPPRGGCVAS
ncbi:MAG: radical SAM protein [Planctomycetota bacterium]|jgi:radical SAM protein with 4Fe4S-binding SPASM domain